MVDKVGQISAGEDATVWLVVAGALYAFDPGMTSFVAIEGPEGATLAQAAVSTDLSPKCVQGITEAAPGPPPSVNSGRLHLTPPVEVKALSPSPTEAISNHNNEAGTVATYWPLRAIRRNAQAPRSLATFAVS